MDGAPKYGPQYTIAFIMGPSRRRTLIVVNPTSRIETVNPKSVPEEPKSQASVVGSLTRMQSRRASKLRETGVPLGLGLLVDLAQLSLLVLAYGNTPRSVIAKSYPQSVISNATWHLHNPICQGSTTWKLFCCFNPP